MGPMLDSSLPISVSTFKKTTPMTFSGASEPTTADSTTWLSTGETPLPMLDSSLPTLLVTTAATDSFGTSGPSTSDGNTWLSTGETPRPMLDSSLPALLVTGTAGLTHDPSSTMFALLETPLRMS